MGTRSPRAEVFQFTHPVWGATTSSHLCVYPLGVSIHAPRVGCDHEVQQVRLELRAFQFTHPVWGATTIPHKTDCLSPRFNSRTPCGVRLNNAWADARSDKVSIHAPRVGCDLTRWKQRGAWAEFQFTHPVWGATTSKTLKDLFLEFQFTHPVWGATAMPKGTHK